ncbi:MAG: hypothetical protein QM726_17645 [Chitinophagaceae bacterium]
MKKHISATINVAMLLLMITSFSSCFKDKCTHAYKIFTPVYSTLANLRAQVKTTGAIPIENPGKMYIQGKWIFLNEQNKGIHVIDNSNPAHPVNASFINIPGNIDINTKQNTLYADMYCDLVAININNPTQTSVSKYLTNTFSEKSSSATATNPDSIKVITNWLSKDTVIDCSTASYLQNCANCNVFFSPTMSTAASSSSTTTAGQAGSMARFAAVNNYLYAVSTSNLRVIDVSNAANPLLVNNKLIGWNIETIFPYNNKLYVGAGSSMSAYSLETPEDPQPLSWSGHWCSGDPVVADDNYAYVTLHAANICRTTVNQLEIYNLSTPNNPKLEATYPLNNPLGLSKDGNLLFICDDGLKIYDVSNVNSIKLLKSIKGFQSYDVIASNGIAYVVTKDGLYQYDYSDIGNTYLLSRILK